MSVYVASTSVSPINKVPDVPNPMPVIVRGDPPENIKDSLTFYVSIIFFAILVNMEMPIYVMVMS